MPQKSIVKYLNPWKYRRDQQADRMAGLRARDGDDCARCRRPMRFDLPAGHDLGAKVEQVVAGRAGKALENWRLCHGRCNPVGVNHTEEVTERARRKNEAALFAKAKKRRAA